MFTSTPLTIYYSRVRVPVTIPPLLLLPRNLAEVLVLDPDAWAPVTAIRRVAAGYLADQGLPPLSSQQLNRELSTRGLPRTTRKGVPGYPGFYVSDETAAAGKLRAGSRATRASRERVRKDRRNHVDQVITGGA
ncbi:hypothetical protein [Curtobacterium sp. 'Ferrero']|uniref:hypothetical protein n=1 Tax=Curtobacterium sp. 'Ferrero' TaxID=2033654 RepID=UPI0020D1C707|nr:hypothetical protein [Curtobacterium sp. 'Ferrero']